MMMVLQSDIRGKKRPKASPSMTESVRREIRAEPRHLTGEAYQGAVEYRKKKKH